MGLRRSAPEPPPGDPRCLSRDSPNGGLRMRRLLLATTAISALALGTPLALAQSSTAPGGALEEQKQPPDKSGKTANPTMPGQGMHNGSPPAGRSAQTPEASP